MRQFPHVFSPLATGMVKAGEESGTLSGSLKVVSEHLEKSYILNKRIALMYPTIIIIAMILIGVVMLIFVVPTLTGTYKELGIDLPFTTQMIIFVSDFLQNNIVTSFLIIVAVGIILSVALRSRRGKRIVDALILKSPIIGFLVKEVNSARTARTLSSLLSSGVPLTEALSITRDVVQNSYYQDVLEEARKKIQKGVTLSSVFTHHQELYPILVGEMIAVGEETGKLSDMLMKLSVFYEEEVEYATKDLSTIIEPILMIFVGVVVAFFALAMITPIYSLVGGL